MDEQPGTAEEQVVEPPQDAAEAGPEAPGGAEGEVAPAAEEEAASPWAPNPPRVQRYKDADAVARAAAKRFLDTAKRAVEKSDRFIVVLAGGSTPRALYRLLAESPYRERVPWKKTFFVFSDERCVHPEDEESNYYMAKETLFDPLEISEHHVLRMKGEQVPVDAARRYGVRLGDLFLNRPKRHFDLALLGIGADGHTASLFPGTAALEEKVLWAVANEVPQLDAWRLTLTLPALRSARRIIFMALGEEKAQVIAEAFGGVEHETPHPCELIAPRFARREVLIDHAAASRIPQDESKQEPCSGDEAPDD